MSDPLGGAPISYYQPEGLEGWQERLEQPAPSLKATRGLLDSLAAKGKRLLDGVDAFIDWVKKPTHSAPEPTSLQEMLETRTFDFKKAVPLDWERANRFKGIVALYRDLIALRRNLADKTGGLTAPKVNVFHADGSTRK